MHHVHDGAHASVRTPGSTAYRLTTVRPSSAAPVAIMHGERDLRDHEAVLQTSAAPAHPSGAGPAQDAAQVAAVERDDRHQDRQSRCRGTAIAIAEANTRQSGAADSAHAPSGSARMMKLKPPHASAAPSAPERPRSACASTMSDCVSRCRLAPSAERTASSTDRASTCPSISAATFAHAINRISAIAAERRQQRRPHRAA